MSAIELPESAKIGISNAMLILAKKGEELERQRKRLAKAATKKLLKERQEEAQYRLRRERQERHQRAQVAIATQGLHVLCSLAQSTEIQELLAQRHLAKYGIQATKQGNQEGFKFYYATSLYDRHAPDFASIVFDTDGVELGYGVEKIDDRPRIRIDFNAQDSFDDKLASLFGGRQGGSPLRHLHEERFEHCSCEGSGALFRVVYDCASPRRLEKYLDVAIQRFIKEPIDEW